MMTPFLSAGIKPASRQMVNRIILRLALIVLAVVGCIPAMAQTSTNYLFSVPLSTTDWSNNVPIRQFSPSLGILESVTLTYTGVLQAQVHFTNNGNGTAHITMSENSAFYVTTNALFSVNLAFSGLATQHGGFTNSALLVAGGFGAQSFTNSLNAFIGAGVLNLPVSTITDFSLTTSGSSSVALQTLASLDGLISYTYLSTSPSPVPEPGLIRLLALGSGLLLAGRRWGGRAGSANSSGKIPRLPW